jgi:hypothetical protein
MEGQKLRQIQWDQRSNIETILKDLRSQDNFCGTWTEVNRWLVITAVAIIGRIDIPEGRGDITANY